MKKELKKLSLIGIALLASLFITSCGGDDGPAPLTNGEKIAVTWRATSVVKTFESNNPEDVTSSYSSYSITLSTDDQGNPSSFTQVLPSNNESTPDYNSNASSGTWTFSQGTASLVFTAGGTSSTVTLTNADFSSTETLATVTVTWEDPDINAKGPTTYVMTLNAQ